MTHGHTIWFWLVWACVIWYSTITVYVSVKGAFDIQHMLRTLEKNRQESGVENPQGRPGEEKKS